MNPVNENVIGAVKEWWGMLGLNNTYTYYELATLTNVVELGTVQSIRSFR